MENLLVRQPWTGASNLLRVTVPAQVVAVSHFICKVSEIYKPRCPFSGALAHTTLVKGQSNTIQAFPLGSDFRWGERLHLEQVPRVADAVGSYRIYCSRERSVRISGWKMPSHFTLWPVCIISSVPFLLPCIFSLFLGLVCV